MKRRGFMAGSAAALGLAAVPDAVEGRPLRPPLIDPGPHRSLAPGWTDGPCLVLGLDRTSPLDNWTPAARVAIIDDWLAEGFIDNARAMELLNGS